MRLFLLRCKAIMRYLGHRIWWLDVLYPIVLAVFLISLLTHVLYSGQKHMRLASLGENSLMRTSLLMFNTSRVDRAVASVVVSLVEGDLTQIPVASDSDVRDSSIEGYAKVLRRIAFSAPKLVILSWTPAAHVGGLEADYTPLVNALRQVPANVKILFAYPPTEKWTLPSALQRVATFVADNPCDDYSEVQLACPLNAANHSFDEWVVQKMLLQVSPNYPSLRKQGKVSEEIARTHPSFIVNVPPVSALTRYSFSDVLAPQMDLNALRGKVVLVGNELIQSPNTRSNAAIRRVFNNQSAQRENIHVNGTPLHIFWSQLVELFAQDDLVRIPSSGEQTTIVILFCLCVLAIIHRLGDVAAIGTFLGFVTLAPAVNSISIRLFQCYIPLFDLYYFGLGTLVLAGFGRLSKEALDRWRIDERQRYHAHTADLKGNFTSLVSHNLNTPIAKLQGILDLLQRTPNAKAWQNEVSRAQGLAALLQLYVKCVLVSTAIEEGSLNFVASTVQRLREEFVGQFSSMLAKLQIAIDTEVAQSSDEDANFVSIKVDIRALTVAIATLLVIAKRAANQDAATRLKIQFSGSIDDKGDPRILISMEENRVGDSPPTVAWTDCRSLLLQSDSREFSRHDSVEGRPQILKHLLCRGIQLHRGEMLEPSLARKALGVLGFQGVVLSIGGAKTGNQ